MECLPSLKLLSAQCGGTSCRTDESAVNSACVMNKECNDSHFINGFLPLATQIYSHLVRVCVRVDVCIAFLTALLYTQPHAQELPRGLS